MGFSRQEYWSGLPFPSPGDLPNQGIEPRSPALQADSLLSEPPGLPRRGPMRERQIGFLKQSRRWWSDHWRPISRRLSEPTWLFLLCRPLPLSIKALVPRLSGGSWSLDRHQHLLPPPILLASKIKQTFLFRSPGFFVDFWVVSSGTLCSVTDFGTLLTFRLLTPASGRVRGLGGLPRGLSKVFYRFSSVVWYVCLFVNIYLFGCIRS